MTAAKAVHRYVRAVSRRLICSGATSSRLLDGLRQELLAYPMLSYEELCVKIGTPEQTAAQLMETISESEIACARRKRGLALGLLILIPLVIALVFVAYYIHSQQVMRDDFYFKEQTTSSTNRVVSDGMLED